MVVPPRKPRLDRMPGSTGLEGKNLLERVECGADLLKIRA